MIVKLLTEHHLKFLSFEGGCRGSSESTLVKMSNCWKSHAPAILYVNLFMVSNSVSIFCFLAVNGTTEIRTCNNLKFPKR